MSTPGMHVKKIRRSSCVHIDAGQTVRDPSAPLRAALTPAMGGNASPGACATRPSLKAAGPPSGQPRPIALGIPTAEREAEG